MTARESRVDRKKNLTAFTRNGNGQVVQEALNPCRTTTQRWPKTSRLSVFHTVARTAMES
jgi:hypothetical protein